MFAVNDEEAGWHGWQVQRRHAGLGRRYRDPMFDTLIRCPDCRGNGTIAAGACARCSGTGRIVLDQPPIPRDG
jgi:DnaJ-class molecular chaperone